MVVGSVEAGHWYLLEEDLVELLRSESHMGLSKIDVEKLETRETSLSRT